MDIFFSQKSKSTMNEKVVINGACKSTKAWSRIIRNYCVVLCAHNIPMCSAVMGTAGRDSITSLEAGGA